MNKKTLVNILNSYSIIQLLNETKLPNSIFINTKIIIDSDSQLLSKTFNLDLNDINNPILFDNQTGDTHTFTDISEFKELCDELFDDELIDTEQVELFLNLIITNNDDDFTITFDNVNEMWKLHYEKYFYEADEYTEFIENLGYEMSLDAIDEDPEIEDTTLNFTKI